ncbi:MAG: electron transfer flavoprotein subunit alpha/FixB family protein [Pyrinomonadaceae bacterium]
MSKGILTFIEHRAGTLNKTSLEAITAAQKLGSDLGEEVIVFILGFNIESLANEIANYAVAKVLFADDERLADYTPDAYTDAATHIVRQLDPAFIIMAHTYQVRDFAPKLAARFGKDVICDCVRCRLNESEVIFSRRIFLGKLDADVISSGSPVFVTFQSGAFRAELAEKGSGASVEKLAAEIGEVRMKPEPPFKETKQSVDLTRAEVIVAVGRGIKSQENIGIVEKLAQTLGAELAASRPICDAGWLPIDRQIGSSGQTVAPKVYIALGISGAIQHLVGMKNSGTIIAINKDAEAPIFDIADYGIVGDLFEVVPALTDEIAKIKAGS